jgi:octaprenyl-diphosphate synthase
MKKRAVVVVRVFMSEIFESIRSLIAEDQKAVDQLILESLQSNVELINQIGKHIIKSGGKRLRPLLVLLSAKAFGYEGFSHIQLAAIIELLHTATLLHDDVVDSSELRRGQSTANKMWGDHASVLVGDYLFSRSFQLMVQVNEMKVMEILSHTSNQMAEGEVLQLLNCQNPDISEENYMEVIRYKTGTLFSAAAQMGAILTKRSLTDLENMIYFGHYLGTTFQLVDDALDYSASSDAMGKNMGDDLLEGKPTLPFIRALSQVNNQDAQTLRNAMCEGSVENILELIKIIESTDAISYTYSKAHQHALIAKKYLEKIPSSLYRDGLFNLIEFALARHY